jgi:hypothetical protein
MRAPHVLISAPCSHVEDMSKKIEIEVPDEFHEMLEEPV